MLIFLFSIISLASAQTCRYMFATSTRSNGNFGSAANADSVCATAAQNAPTGTPIANSLTNYEYKAFLRVQGRNFMNDFTGERTVNCVDRPDGTRLFDDVTNIQGVPAAPINRDETNTAITSNVRAWTGLGNDLSNCNNCNAFGTGNRNTRGCAGSVTSANNWMVVEDRARCSANYRIYCLGVPLALPSTTTTAPSTAATTTTTAVPSTSTTTTTAAVTSTTTPLPTTTTTKTTTTTTKPTTTTTTTTKPTKPTTTSSTAVTTTNAISSTTAGATTAGATTNTATTTSQATSGGSSTSASVSSNAATPATSTNGDATSATGSNGVTSSDGTSGTGSSPSSSPSGSSTSAGSTSASGDNTASTPASALPAPTAPPAAVTVTDTAGGVLTDANGSAATTFVPAVYVTDGAGSTVTDADGAALTETLSDTTDDNTTNAPQTTIAESDANTPQTTLDNGLGDGLDTIDDIKSAGVLLGLGLLYVIIIGAAIYCCCILCIVVVVVLVSRSGGGGSDGETINSEKGYSFVAKYDDLDYLDDGDELDLDDLPPASSGVMDVATPLTDDNSSESLVQVDLSDDSLDIEMLTLEK